MKASILTALILGMAAVTASCGETPAELDALSVAAGETTPAATRASNLVPFVAHWIATQGPDASPDDMAENCPPLAEQVQPPFELDAVGHATHLGAFTGDGVTCIFNPRIVTDPPWNLHGGEPPFLLVDFHHRSVWTAANGDKLYLSSSEPGTNVISLTDGTFSAMGGAIVISGGTGRFEGASGGAESPVAINEQVTFEGWILYDASNRRAH